MAHISWVSAHLRFETSSYFFPIVANALWRRAFSLHRERTLTHETNCEWANSTCIRLLSLLLLNFITSTVKRWNTYYVDRKNSFTFMAFGNIKNYIKCYNHPSITSHLSEFMYTNFLYCFYIQGRKHILIRRFPLLEILLD